jgi:hypothetical protein
LKSLQQLTNGVYIKQYHADNGRFKDNYFMKSIEESGRKSKPPERLQYAAHSCLIHLNEYENEETWSEQLFLAYKASTDPDTMYHHQAMKQPDTDKFQEAMEKECEAHFTKGNYKLIRKEELPEGATLFITSF